MSTASSRVAAIGDLHVQENNIAPYREMFTEISDVADVLVLCGDLTNFGKTSEAEILAEDIKSCDDPGHRRAGQSRLRMRPAGEVTEILHEAGMTVLDEQAIEIEGVGFAGVKGFMGGYGRGELAPFGEPIAKAFVDEAMNEARKLENGLRSLADRPQRRRAALFADHRHARRRARGDLPISRLAAAGRRDRPLRPCEGGRSRPRSSWPI